MRMCPVDAVDCSDVAVVALGVGEIVGPIIVALVVIGILVYFARRRRQR